MQWIEKPDKWRERAVMGRSQCCPPMLGRCSKKDFPLTSVFCCRWESFLYADVSVWTAAVECLDWLSSNISNATVKTPQSLNRKSEHNISADGLIIVRNDCQTTVRKWLFYTESQDCQCANTAFCISLISLILPSGKSWNKHFWT